MSKSITMHCHEQIQTGKMRVSVGAGVLGCFTDTVTRENCKRYEIFLSLQSTPLHSNVIPIHVYFNIFLSLWSSVILILYWYSNVWSTTLYFTLLYVLCFMFHVTVGVVIRSASHLFCYHNRSFTYLLCITSCVSPCPCICTFTYPCLSNGMIPSYTRYHTTVFCRSSVPWIIQYLIAFYRILPFLPTVLP